MRAPSTQIRKDGPPPVPFRVRVRAQFTSTFGAFAPVGFDPLPDDVDGDGAVVELEPQPTSVVEMAIIKANRIIRRMDWTPKDGGCC
jgi:hypothetical protein